MASVNRPWPSFRYRKLRRPSFASNGGIGHLAVVVAGDGDEEVEIAVAVDVGEGGRAGVLGHRDAGSRRRLLERPVAAVAEEARRAECVGHEESGMAVAVDVPRGEAGRRDALGRRFREAGLLGDVGESSPAVAAIEDRPHAVADEEVLGSVRS